MLYLNKEKAKDKIFYTTDEKDQGQFINLYKEQKIEVLATNPVIDTHLMNFLEGKIAPAKFHRIDSSVEEGLIDYKKEKNLLVKN